MFFLTLSRKPFATLGTTTYYQATLKPDILLSDTVGFIRSLPQTLIAIFDLFLLLKIRIYCLINRNPVWKKGFNLYLKN